MNEETANKNVYLISSGATPTFLKYNYFSEVMCGLKHSFIVRCIAIN